MVELRWLTPQPLSMCVTREYLGIRDRSNVGTNDKWSWTIPETILLIELLLLHWPKCYPSSIRSWRRHPVRERSSLTLVSLSWVVFGRTPPSLWILFHFPCYSPFNQLGCRCNLKVFRWTVETVLHTGYLFLVILCSCLVRLLFCSLSRLFTYVFHFFLTSLCFTR